jgi:hypothetical protein
MRRSRVPIAAIQQGGHFKGVGGLDHGQQFIRLRTASDAPLFQPINKILINLFKKTATLCIIVYPLLKSIELYIACLNTQYQSISYFQFKSKIFYKPQ